MRLHRMTAAFVVAGTAAALAAPATAATSSASRAAVSHGKYALGYVPSTTTVKLPAAAKGPVLVPLDQVPDYYALSQNAPPIGNQGAVGDCVEWAIDYNLMGYWARKNAAWTSDFQPMSVYKQIAGKGMPAVGTDPAKALSLTQKTGVLRQSAYFQGSQDSTTVITAAEKAWYPMNRLTSSTTLWTGKGQGTTAAKNAIEQSIASGYPVAIGFDVYDSFENWGTTIEPYTTDSGTDEGGHMVAAFDYDQDGLWIRNSWGTSWGMGGTAHLSWDWIGRQVSAAYAITGAFTMRTGAKPAIVTQSIKSASADGGDTLTMQVTDVSSADANVFIGGSDAAPTYSESPDGKRFVTVTVPQHAAGAVSIGIQGDFGTNPKAGSITLLPDAPTITSLSANTGPLKGGTKVTVTGTNFVMLSKVTVGSVKVTYKVTSPTTIVLTTPKNTIGAKSITVTTAGGVSSGNDNTLFYYGITPPSASS